MRQHDTKRRLNQSPPPDLRARCVATIPQEARDNAHRSVISRRHTTQKLVFVGGVLAVVLVGSAFWTTRPLNNASNHISGSAAFAQTVKAMQDVGYVHISARRINTADEDGASEPQWYHADGWFDADQGQYWTAGHKPNSQATSSPENASNPTRVLSKLQLPDGTAYARSGATLTISKNPQKWQLAKRTLPLSLLGNAALVAAENSRSNGAESAPVPKLQSAQTIRWQGQPTKLLQFEVAPSRNVLGTRTNLYVDVKTSRVIEMREFAVKEGAPDRMVVQARADYTRPDITLFSASKISVGATKVDEVNDASIHIRPINPSDANIPTVAQRVGVDVPLFMAPIPADLDVAPRQIFLQRVTPPSGKKARTNRIFIAPLTDTVTLLPSQPSNGGAFSIDVTTTGGLFVRVPLTLNGDSRMDIFVQKGRLTDAQIKALKAKVDNANTKARSAKIFILRRNAKSGASLSKEQTKIIAQLRKQVLDGVFPGTSSPQKRVRIPLK